MIASIPGAVMGYFDYMGPSVMARSELHLHLEGTVDRETLMLLDPSVPREVIDEVWGFTDFAGFLSCFKFIAQRLRGPEDDARSGRRAVAGIRFWRGVAGDSRGPERGPEAMAG